MTNREIFHSFRADVGQIENPELGTLHQWLRDEPSFAAEAGEEFVLAVNGEVFQRRMEDAA